jgi:apolipoprotein D and lipocalin family protein
MSGVAPDRPDARWMRLFFQSSLVSMRPTVRLFATLTLAFALPGLAVAAPLTEAPQPAKPVEVSRYLGQWFEIARLHNRIEEACSSARSQYTQEAGGKISAVQICEKPGGGAKTYRASVHILDAGTNAKMRLSFFPLISKEYWVLDHAPDYAWSIVGTKEGKYLWLFARTAHPAAAEKAAIVARTQALGYDTSKLIYPQ